MAQRLALIIVVLLGCVSCDQVTKSVAESFLADSATLSYFNDTLRLQLAYNQGAFLGMGSSLTESWRHTFFILGAGVMLLALLGFMLFAKLASRYELLALSLILSGGIGNMIDRVLNNGYVIDFINLGIGPVRTGIFNVADMAISGGALFVFWTAMSGWNKRGIEKHDEIDL